MQEFWVTATVHHHAIRFKMDNKKHIVNLESFRDMLRICPRVHGQTFDEPTFEEEILAFIRFLGHGAAIRTLADVNINKLYQAWRSFAAIINKCLTGKSFGYDSLRLSQAQILWGLYHKRNVAMTEAQQLKLVTKRSMQQMHISQPSGSGADKGTGDGEEDQGLNISEEERHVEEEEEDELYRDININQGRGIQANLEVEDSHVTLTPFAGVVSAIPGIVQRYMDHRMNEAVKVAVQIQSDRLCEEAQRENDEFLKTIDVNMKKIIKEHVKEQVKVQVSKILPRNEQTVNEQLEAKVLTRSSHSSKTSYDIVADLSERELKKILIEKMEGNKSIQRSDEQRNLYKALVEAYKSDKIILDTYGETITLKRRRDDDADKDKEPSAGPDMGSKRRREGKELDELAKQSDSRFSFNELMDTPLDFSNFLMNRLKVDTLTPELLASPTYELMKGSCNSLVELEYHLEVFKATTDQLDWVNPEGQQYPHNLLKTLPFIPNNQGHRVIPFEHFINNDLEYLRGGASSRKYTTSITKTKAADYGHIKWIEDLVPRTMWIKEPTGYDKHALWGNKDKRNTLMRIDELHKFSNGTLIDVRTALDDRLKGIRMHDLHNQSGVKIDCGKSCIRIPFRRSSRAVRTS
nr:hypothetical protein [Tanacetum cinerariifolium]